MHYGERWRAHRRVIHKKLHPVAVAEYQPIQLNQTRFVFLSVRLQYIFSVF
jgi:cytochrome P450